MEVNVNEKRKWGNEREREIPEHVRVECGRHTRHRRLEERDSAAVREGSSTYVNLCVNILRQAVMWAHETLSIYGTTRAKWKLYTQKNCITSHDEKLEKATRNFPSFAFGRCNIRKYRYVSGGVGAEKRSQFWQTFPSAWINIILFGTTTHATNNSGREREKSENYHQYHRILFNSAPLSLSHSFHPIVCL